MLCVSFPHPPRHTGCVTVLTSEFLLQVPCQSRASALACPLLSNLHRITHLQAHHLHACRRPRPLVQALPHLHTGLPSALRDLRRAPCRGSGCGFWPFAQGILGLSYLEQGSEGVAWAQMGTTSRPHSLGEDMLEGARVGPGETEPRPGHPAQVKGRC